MYEACPEHIPNGRSTVIGRCREKLLRPPLHAFCHVMSKYSSSFRNLKSTGEQLERAGLAHSTCIKLLDVRTGPHLVSHPSREVPVGGGHALERLVHAGICVGRPAQTGSARRGSGFQTTSLAKYGGKGSPSKLARAREGTHVGIKFVSASHCIGSHCA